MTVFRLLACLLPAFVLVACGGGSSSDGAGSDNSTAASSSPPDPSAAGTYNGLAEVVLAVLGETENFSGPVRIDITPEGRVTVTIEGVSADTTLSGNSFTASLPFRESSGGIQCDGTIRVRGTVSGNSVAGPIDGSADCSDGILSAEADVDGDYSATR